MSALLITVTSVDKDGHAVLAFDVECSLANNAAQSLADVTVLTLKEFIKRELPHITKVIVEDTHGAGSVKSTAVHVNNTLNEVMPAKSGQVKH